MAARCSADEGARCNVECEAVARSLHSEKGEHRTPRSV